MFDEDKDSQHGIVNGIESIDKESERKDEDDCPSVPIEEDCGNRDD